MNIWYDAVLASSVPTITTYAGTLVSTYGASEVWPLVNIASGTTILAHVNATRNGTLSGWALQNAAGPVTGTLAPLSDGSDYGNIYTSGANSLDAIWTGSEFSVFGWGKASSWAGAAGGQDIFRVRVSGNNLVQIGMTGTGDFEYVYVAGGTTKTVTYSAHGSPAGWFSYGVSVSKTADEFKAFFGLAGGSIAQVGTTQTGLGTWSGSLNNSTCCIGARNTSGANTWPGHMAYTSVKVGGIWTTTQFANMHAAAATAVGD